MPLGNRIHRDRRSRRLAVEALEDRRMLATFTVTNLLDGPVTAAGDLPGSLRQAIFDANNKAGADDINFSGVSGTLLMTDGEFQITDALTLNGPGQDLLTIDAQQQSRVFNITATTGDFSFVGVAIVEGKLDSPSLNGAGIHSSTSGTLFLVDSAITGSDVVWRGGGVYAAGPLSSTRTTFASNQSYYGGAAFSATSIALLDSIVSGNNSIGGAAGIEAPIVTVYSSLVRENSSLYGPGGLSGTDVSVFGSEISNNQTGPSEFPIATGGAGIFGTSVYIKDSLIGGNFTRDTFHDDPLNPVNAIGGGGVRAQDVTVVNSTISGNRAGSGGYYTFAGSGGGILSSGDVTILNSTITGNAAGLSELQDGSGGGIFVLGSGSIEIVNSIIAGNHADNTGKDLAYSNQITQVVTEYTLFSSSSGPIEQLLGPLQDNGGPTWTHALLPGSPAIDMGDPAFTSPPDFDQRGAPFVRIHNGRIDIGAYESQPLLADANGDQVVDGLDFLLIQSTGGDIAQWNAEYGVSEPTALLAAVATGEDTPAAFWLSLPELDADQRGEPLPAYVALEPIDRAFNQDDSQESSDERDAPLTLPRTSDATDEPVDAELDEAIVALFG